MKRQHKNQDGMVLIAVLWGIFIMASVALALSSLVRAEGDSVRGRKEQLQAYYLARGGVFRTVALLVAPPPVTSPEAAELTQRRLEWKSDIGQAHVDVLDESGKLDLNRTPKEMLQRLFEALGMDLQAATVLVNAIEDWRDAGFAPLLNQGHPAKRDFSSVQELLLVKGVTAGLFWGRYVVSADGQVQRQPGLVDCLSVYAQGGKVNINDAPYPVLMAVPGMEPRVANYILQSRAQHPFKSVSDVSEEFPVLLGLETLSYLDTAGPGPYSIVGTGTMKSGVAARVRAVVKLDNGQAGGFRILSWDDSYVR